MKASLTIIDDFHPDAMVFRERVIASHFGDQIGPDGETYKGISLHQEPGLFPLIEQAIGQSITPKLSFYRINVAGEVPHCAVHCDQICASQASILYLNPPEDCHGGTAFWKHKELGLDAMPTAEDVAHLNIPPQSLIEEFVNDWKDMDKWEQVGFVGMKFNRFVTYPTALVHSRWPHEGFGDSPSSARLVWVCFYDINPSIA